MRQGGANISHTVRGRLNPTRKMLDMFLCTDGLPIDKSDLFQGYNTLWDETRNRDYRMWAYFHPTIPEGGSPMLTGETDINSGVAPLTNAFATTYDLDIKEEIRRERAIELFGEDSRFIDLKRWGIAEEILGATLHGPIVEGTVYETDASLYQPELFPEGEESIVVGDGTAKRTLVIDPSSERPFKLQHYLYSIPVNEILIGEDLLQNPGW